MLKEIRTKGDLEDLAQTIMIMEGYQSAFEVVDDAERPHAQKGEIVVVERVPFATVEGGQHAVVRIKGGFTIKRRPTMGEIVTGKYDATDPWGNAWEYDAKILRAVVGRVTHYARLPHLEK